MEQATGNVTWVNRCAEYDRFLDLLTIAKEQAGVKNTATAFGLLLDWAEKPGPRRSKPTRRMEPA